MAGAGEGGLSDSPKKERLGEKVSQGVFKCLVLSTSQRHSPTLIIQWIYLQGKMLGS